MSLSRHVFLGSGFNLSILEGTIGCIPMKSFSLSLSKVTLAEGW